MTVAQIDWIAETESALCAAEESERQLAAERVLRRELEAKNAALAAGLRHCRRETGVPRDLVLALLGGAPTPAECLRAVEDLFPNDVVVLDEAHRSGAKASAFRGGNELLKLLIELGRTLAPAFRVGGSAVQEARAVFGDNYASTESQTTLNNPELRKARTFRFQGRTLEMFRHLKIGVEDSVVTSIRVHFAWEADLDRLIIGHCGKHLPLLSH